MPEPVVDLDPGVRAAVVRLNSIEGVVTRASCEGQGPTRGHTHSALAYVAFEYPLPLDLQDFLAAELNLTGRVEDDAVYSRWPQANREFIEALVSAARRYRAQQARRRRVATRCSLPKLRSRLATRLAGGNEVNADVCLGCRALVVQPHRCGGQTRTLLHWPAGIISKWFLEFLAEPGNSLDQDLVTALGDVELEVRARAGDFGVTFQRRWARHRAAAIRNHLICGVRSGVANIRRSGVDLDVVFDAGYARLTWGSRKLPRLSNDSGHVGTVG